jgi:hypothetical protein
MGQSLEGNMVAKMPHQKRGSMTVILVLITFVWFLVMDAVITPIFIKPYKSKNEGTYVTTPGFEMLGALAQDGGELADEKQGKSK